MPDPTDIAHPSPIVVDGLRLNRGESGVKGVHQLKPFMNDPTLMIEIELKAINIQAVLNG